MFKMMENHPLKKKHDVTERISLFFKRFEVLLFIYDLAPCCTVDPHTCHVFPEENCTAELHLYNQFSLRVIIMNMYILLW